MKKRLRIKTIYAPLPEIKDKLDSVLLVFHLIKRFLRLSLISIITPVSSKGLSNFIFGFKLRLSNYTLFIINETQRWLKILKYSYRFIELVKQSFTTRTFTSWNFKNIYFLIQKTNPQNVILRI